MECTSRGCAAAPVITGPNVLIVIVEVSTFAPTVGGLNEHTGGIVTSGLIDAHDNVTSVPAYPLIGLRVTSPWPPLPAGTEVGATGLDTVIENCGVTASTVNASGAAVCVPVDAVPLIVTE